MTRSLQLELIYTECDCDAWLHLRVPSTRIFRPASEKKALEIFLDVIEKMNCGAPNIDLWTGGDCLWPAPFCDYHGERRYHLICVPGKGHVFGLRRKT